MSLKSAQNTIALKKQVYKPILENPYTDSSKFPHVNSQNEIRSLLEISVLRTYRQFYNMSMNTQNENNNNSAHLQCPVDILFGFNRVMQYLESPIDEPCFVFVCNKDGLTQVLHHHLPMLIASRNSTPNRVNMTRLIQLPKSSLAMFNENLPYSVPDAHGSSPVLQNGEDSQNGDYHYGILLVKGENIPGSLKIHVHTNVPIVSIPYIETTYVPCQSNLHLINTSMPLKKNEKKGKVLKKKKNMIKK